MSIEAAKAAPLAALGYKAAHKLALPRSAQARSGEDRACGKAVFALEGRDGRDYLCRLGVRSA